MEIPVAYSLKPRIIILCKCLGYYTITPVNSAAYTPVNDIVIKNSTKKEESLHRKEVEEFLERKMEIWRRLF